MSDGRYNLSGGICIASHHRLRQETDNHVIYNRTDITGNGHLNEHGNGHGHGHCDGNGNGKGQEKRKQKEEK